jgi:hypothetical protein
VGADDQLIADVVLTVEGAAEPEKYDNTEIYVRKTGFVSGVRWKIWTSLWRVPKPVM